MMAICLRVARPFMAFVLLSKTVYSMDSGLPGMTPYICSVNVFISSGLRIFSQSLRVWMTFPSLALSTSGSSTEP
ncbi:MAG: hypothetical protein J6T79_03545 [Verrucomicrobia bacterium]|nr:hypothetical protein [Verrucomicrobiota bacterium]